MTMHNENRDSVSAADTATDPDSVLKPYFEPSITLLDVTSTRAGFDGGSDGVISASS